MRRSAPHNKRIPQRKNAKLHIVDIELNNRINMQCFKTNKSLPQENRLKKKAPDSKRDEKLEECFYFIFQRDKNLWLEKTSLKIMKNICYYPPTRRQVKGQEIIYVELRISLKNKLYNLKCFLIYCISLLRCILKN